MQWSIDMNAPKPLLKCKFVSKNEDKKENEQTNKSCEEKRGSPGTMSE